MKNINKTKQTFTSLFVLGLLTYILFNTKDLITIIVVIPFLIFSLGLFLKNIFLMLDKKSIARIMEIIYVMAFFIYYFGFLICWDYVAIGNKDYMSVVLSLLAWFGGLFVAYKRYSRLKNK